MSQETYSCHLTEDCGAKLKCGAESIHVEFPKELFGEVNGADNITPAIKKTDAGYEIGRDFEILTDSPYMATFEPRGNLNPMSQVLY